MAAEKKPKAKGVTAEEVNYLLSKLRDLRAEHETIKRHLNMIDERLGDLEETVGGFDVEEASG